MKILRFIVFVLFLLQVACAQVPKESVELSATVGRDIAEIRKSHIALVNLYYGELISDINNFVDNVYLPYQVQNTLSDDVWKTEMLSAIESASRVDSTGISQKEGFQKIEAFILIVQEEVEGYRKLKLEPVKKQYAEVLSSINQTYDQVHYANSIVTGHLASVVKVHDTQNELLSEIGLENLRIEAGETFSGASKKIGDLINRANKGEEKIDSIISKFDNIF